MFSRIPVRPRAEQYLFLLQVNSISTALISQDEAMLLLKDIIREEEWTPDLWPSLCGTVWRNVSSGSSQMRIELRVGVKQQKGKKRKIQKTASA
ncbi:hypothetical protein AOLI_G00193040 [Acnodon oligacanthus]